MQDLNDKVNNGGASAAGQLDADEWNQIPTEIQNVIEGLGITLSGGDLNQLGKAIAGYVANGDFYIDSGIANAYDLAVVGSKQAPTEYTDGATFRFIPTNTNTDSSTAIVASLGIKTIKGVDGDNLVGGELVVGTEMSLVFDAGGDILKLIPVLDNATFVNVKSGRKNYIINGDYDIWQRGTSGLVIDGFLADRWLDSGTGGTSFTISQQSFTLGQTVVPNNPIFFHRAVVTTGSGAGDRFRKIQRIKGVSSLSGKVITVSFYAKADSAKDMSVEFLQNFGTGGSPSSEVTAIGVTKLTLSAVFQRFTVTVAIPSVSGKTLGTDSNDYLEFARWFDAGSDFDAQTNSLGNQSGTFDTSQAQLEDGTIATDFEYRTESEELLLCEPYFEKSYDLTVDPGTVATEGRVLEIEVRNLATQTAGVSFKTRKIGIPTIVIFSPATGASGFISNNGDKATTASFPSETRIDNLSITGGTLSFPSFYHWTAEKEL